MPPLSACGRRPKHPSVTARDRSSLPAYEYEIEVSLELGSESTGGEWSRLADGRLDGQWMIDPRGPHPEPRSAGWHADSMPRAQAAADRDSLLDELVNPLAEFAARFPRRGRGDQRRPASPVFHTLHLQRADARILNALFAELAGLRLTPAHRRCSAEKFCWWYFSNWRGELSGGEHGFL